MLIIACGGTIDKVYVPEANGLSFGSWTHVQKMTEQGRYRGRLVVRTLMLKDSLDMTDADRDTVFEACEEAYDTRIVVTHGTDTMPETARLLKSRTEELADKTIVLTGAIIPYMVRNSDGLFNLGAAMALAEILDPGVYLSMHGQVFDPNNVYKDTATNTFTAGSSS